MGIEREDEMRLGYWATYHLISTVQAKPLRHSEGNSQVPVESRNETTREYTLGQGETMRGMTARHPVP